MLNPEVGPIGHLSQRRAFGRLLWRLVRSWIGASVVVTLLSIVLGPVYGYGEIGPLAVPILAGFGFLFALPGSILVIGLIQLTRFEEDYSLLARIVRVGAMSVASASSVVLIALQTPGVTSPGDAVGFLVLIVPVATVWEVIDG